LAPDAVALDRPTRVAASLYYWSPSLAKLGPGIMGTIQVNLHGNCLERPAMWGLGR